MPLLARWRDHYKYGQQIIEIEHVWTTRRRWDQSAFAADTSWRFRTLGPFVLAHRLL